MTKFIPQIDLTNCPWDDALKSELAGATENGCVGSTLVSENERVRIWHFRLHPGARCSFHTHVLDYFWTCLSGGRARSYICENSKYKVTEFELKPGSTRYESFAKGEFKTHNLENTGDIELVFVTVEFLQSANEPLPVPDGVRLSEHDGAVDIIQ